MKLCQHFFKYNRQTNLFQSSNNYFLIPFLNQSELSFSYHASHYHNHVSYYHASHYPIALWKIVTKSSSLLLRQSFTRYHCELGISQCVPVCLSVSQFVSVCPSVSHCVPVCLSVSQCVPVCLSVSQCVPVCPSVSQFVPVCSMQCVPVCPIVSQYILVCPNVSVNFTKKITF